MLVHVLPGDASAEDFKTTGIDGEIIVCRECLIEGEVNAESLPEFWEKRAAFIESEHGGSKDYYHQKVAAELEKLLHYPANTQINLWFEYELFCQVNMWFCLSLLHETEAQVFRVMPVVRSEKNVWKGFGGLDAEQLQECFDKRVKFSHADITLGKDLWEAYQTKNFEKPLELSQTVSDCYPKLKEVCQAEIEKHSRPRKTLENIISTGESDFKTIFQQFADKEGIYGFGDTQVKKIMQAIG